MPNVRKLSAEEVQALEDKGKATRPTRGDSVRFKWERDWQD
jgi:hypothetical protein